MRRQMHMGAVWWLSAVVVCTVAAVAEEPPVRAIDAERSLLDVKLNWDVQHFQSFYLESHPYAPAADVAESLMRIEMTVPAGDQAVFADAECFVRHSEGAADADAKLKELYFDMISDAPAWFPFADQIGLRAGVQIFSWGSGVMYNPTDNLSPWYSVDPFEARRRGLSAVRLSLISEIQNLEFIYIPTFEATELPAPGDRFFLYSPAGGPNPSYPMQGPPMLGYRYGEEDMSEEPSGSRGTEQGAVRYSASVGGWDVALSYFRGYENIAVFEAVPTGVDLATGEADILVRYMYPKEDVWGVDLSKWFGRLGFHAEGTYFDMEETGHDVGVGDKDYGSVLAGIEYTFHDLIGRQDFTVSLEHARELSDESDERIYINRIYQESVLCRIAHVVDYRLSGELRYVHDFETEGSYARLFYDYQYSDHFKVRAGGDVFSGPIDSFYGAYDRNDRVFLKLMMLF